LPDTRSSVWLFSQRYFAHLLVSPKTDESVALLPFSQAYSPVFRVVLPTSHVPFPPPPPTLSTSRPSSPEPHQPDPPLKVLPALSPLFPPPPFVPSHPTFDRLSAIAQQRSDQLRKNAEERLSRVVEACVSEIEKEEELRRQVQLLWSAFREAESVLGQETKLQSPDKRSATADSFIDPAVTDSLSHTSQGSKRLSPVTVSDFVPVSTIRSPSPTHEPHPSALSTSLAVSSFHRHRPERELPRTGRARRRGFRSPQRGYREALESFVIRAQRRHALSDEEPSLACPVGTLVFLASSLVFETLLIPLSFHQVDRTPIPTEKLASLEVVAVLSSALGSSTGESNVLCSVGGIARCLLL